MSSSICSVFEFEFKSLKMLKCYNASSLLCELLFRRGETPLYIPTHPIPDVDRYPSSEIHLPRKPSDMLDPSSRYRLKTRFQELEDLSVFRPGTVIEKLLSIKTPDWLILTNFFLPRSHSARMTR